MTDPEKHTQTYVFGKGKLIAPNGEEFDVSEMTVTTERDTMVDDATGVIVHMPHPSFKIVAFK